MWKPKARRWPTRSRPACAPAARWEAQSGWPRWRTHTADPSLRKGAARSRQRTGEFSILSPKFPCPQNFLPKFPAVPEISCPELPVPEIYEFAFIAASLKLCGANAAPMRPIAIPLRR